MKHVHIVGPPRSGTTLMLELMVNGFGFTDWARRERSLLRPPRARSGLYCSKNPGDAKYARYFLWANPDLWIVAMMRDPRDMVVSRHNYRPSVYWGNLNQWSRAERALRPLRNHPRVVTVRYEDLVADPDAVQRTIAACLPFLRMKRRFSRCHRVARPSRQSLDAMRGIRPVTAESVGAWRQNKARLKGQIALHGDIRARLKELGYEANDDWLHELDGVEPDLRRGFWPDRPSWWSLTRRRGLAAFNLAVALFHVGLQRVARLARRRVQSR